MSPSTPLPWTPHADPLLDRGRVLKTSPEATTFLCDQSYGEVIVKVPQQEGKAAGAWLERLRVLYNTYLHHARVLALVERPRPAAVIEHIPGIDLSEWLRSSRHEDLAMRLGQYFHDAHGRRMPANAKSFLHHAGSYSRHGHARQDGAERQRCEELNERLAHAARGLDEIPMTWSHGDPNLTNIRVEVFGQLRFIDRHRAFDWVFTDLAVVVFVALQARGADLHSRYPDFCRTLLRAYGFDDWGAQQRRVAFLFWAAVSMYLAAPDNTAVCPDWAHGHTLAAALIKASLLSPSSSQLTGAVCG